MLWLTPEELDGRIVRTEVGEEKKLALTYGINTTEGIDLGLANAGKGINSGKATFFGASMKIRLECIITKFDDITLLREQLIRALQVAPSQEKHQQLAAFEEKEYGPILKKITYYKIPLVQSERESIANYAARYETTFEKLAKLADPEKKHLLPIVANISRSTARTFIALLDLAAFNDEDGLFDFDKAQIVANCVMTFYVHGGHHTLLEVGEIYNRLIDYVLLYHPEQLTKGIIPDTPSTTPYIQAADMVEKRMPYYVIGDPHSFLHRLYADKVFPEAEQQNYRP